MKDIQKLLSEYPKARPPLPLAVKKIFDDHYLTNRKSSAANYFHKAIESWLHRVIPDRDVSNKNTLEIGAGTLNHIFYERLENKTYDIIEPKTYLYKDTKARNKIRYAFDNFDSIPKNFYERIISIAVLEHMENLPEFLAKTAYNLKENGYHSHSIPCEGYPFWNVSWSIIRSVPFFLRTGHNFRAIQQHEHLNNLDEIVALTKYFYEDVQIKYSYPSFISPFFSLFANLYFKSPKLKVIENFFNSQHY